MQRCSAEDAVHCTSQHDECSQPRTRKTRACAVLTTQAKTSGGEKPVEVPACAIRLRQSTQKEKTHALCAQTHTRQCTHACTHALIHTHKRTRTHTLMQVHTHTHAHTTHACIHTHHTCMQAYTRIYAHALTHAHTPKREHTHSHTHSTHALASACTRTPRDTRARTRSHAHAHALMHAHALASTHTQQQQAHAPDEQLRLVVEHALVSQAHEPVCA